MPRNTGYTSGAAANATLEPLVQLFPDAVAMRIAVQVSIRGSAGPWRSRRELRPQGHD